jgi:hypothetical protein
MVDDLADLDADLVPDQLLGHPPPDRVGTDELAVVVVDIGVLGEGRHDRVGVTRVDRGDVISDHAAQLSCHKMSLLSGRATVRRPMELTVLAPVRAGSIPGFDGDSPPRGDRRLVLRSHNRRPMEVSCPGAAHGTPIFLP